jgi:hypothetical protein
MKKLCILFLFMVSAAVADAQSGDTAFYTRPYYIGITASGTGYVHGVFSGSPVPVNPAGIPFGPTQVYWSAGYGVMWAFPFARKMECEIGIEGNFVKGWTTEITGVHFSPAEPTRPFYDFATRTTRGNFISTRLQFGREVYRRNDFGVGAGIEAWTAVAAQKDVYNDIGFQVVAKMYLPVSHGSGAVQTSLFYGIAHSGSYLGLRVGFCLKGTRVYRHKPKSYYVRTYED